MCSTNRKELADAVTLPVVQLRFDEELINYEPSFYVGGFRILLLNIFTKRD